jgi:hypothetical protein
VASESLPCPSTGPGNPELGGGGWDPMAWGSSNWGPNPSGGCLWGFRVSWGSPHIASRSKPSGGLLWGEMFLCSNARAGSYNRTFKPQNSRDFLDGCGRFILIFLPGWSLPRFGGAFLSGQAEPNPGVPNCPAAEDGNPSARGMTMKAPLSREAGLSRLPTRPLR